MAGLTTLKERRERLCVKYVDRLQDHSLSLLLQKVEQVGHGYQLRVKKPQGFYMETEKSAGQSD